MVATKTGTVEGNILEGSAWDKLVLPEPGGCLGDSTREAQ